MFKNSWHRAGTIEILHRSSALKYCAFVIFIINDLKIKIRNKVRKDKKN